MGAALHLWTNVTEANGALGTKANGRFRPHQTCTFFCCVGVAQTFPLKIAVALALLAVRGHHAGERNPGVETLHGDSFDPWNEGPKLRKEWRMHHTGVLSSTHRSLVASGTRKRQTIHLVLHLGPQRRGAGKHR